MEAALITCVRSEKGCVLKPSNTNQEEGSYGAYLSREGYWECAGGNRGRGVILVSEAKGKLPMLS